jgi:Sporulation and spore germination
MSPTSLRVRFGAIVGTAVLTITACGIPVDSEPRAISSGLEATPAEPTATEVPASQTKILTIFLLDPNGRVAQSEREAPDTDLATLFAQLTTDPTSEETDLSLTTAVPVDAALIFDEAIPTPSVNQGTARLDFEAGGLDILEGTELSQALAQIVWTLTSTDTDQIDRVAIYIDGELQTWVTPGDGGEHEFLEKDHFESFDPDWQEPTPTPAPTPEPTPTPPAAPTPLPTSGG